VSDLLIGLLGVLLATNQTSAASNLVQKTTGVAVKVPAVNDPVEQQYLKLLADDNAAQEEVDKWIQDNEAFAQKGAGLSKAALSLRVEQRFGPVRKAYEEFLIQHPGHTRARLAFGSFLNDIHEEDAAVQQWEKARELDVKNPAAWNNLANYYGHTGQLKKAFEYYAKAIELNPREPVYYQNFGTTVYLFRKDAREYYQISEQQVFDRALALYAQALKLDPKNFPLATDVAQTYYGIKPVRHEAAMTAWQYALSVANDDIEREGVYLHLARFEMNAGHFEEARKQLGRVTQSMYEELKTKLLRVLAEKETKSKDAPKNTPPANPEAK
jgi:tetratricopeptide (TPR) repeat protein